jgi:hypothetical protein
MTDEPPPIFVARRLSEDRWLVVAPHQDELCGEAISSRIFPAAVLATQHWPEAKLLPGQPGHVRLLSDVSGIGVAVRVRLLLVTVLCAVAPMVRRWEKSNGAPKCAIGFSLGHHNHRRKLVCAIDAPLKNSQWRNLMSASWRR